MTPVEWVYVGNMPHRGNDGFCTYATCSYQAVPKLTDEMLTPFSHLKTYKDLKTFGDEGLEKMMYRSPTDCYVKLNDRTQMFYMDSQGCVGWYVNSDGTVGTKPNNPESVVAGSIAECLTRIDMENRIWMEKVYNISGSMNAASEEYLKLMQDMESEFCA